MADGKAVDPDILPQQAIRPVQPLRFRAEDTAPVRESDYVVVEDVLVVDIKGVGCYSLLCTPGDSIALAVGFAFTEGIISSRNDISVLHYCDDDRGVVRMQIANPEGAQDAQRNLIITSSCGMCGSREVGEGLLSGMSTVGETLRAPTSLLLSVVEQMRGRQRIFSRTGGTHAAAIFSGAGEIIAFSEDIGRHNALDKAIGKCLLEGIPTASCGVVLSGRASFELVAKSARAGLELIAAVSAPSSLAIDAAQRCNITLCGFVRDDRITVYTHSGRIQGCQG